MKNMNVETQWVSLSTIDLININGGTNESFEKGRDIGKEIGEVVGTILVGVLILWGTFK